MPQQRWGTMAPSTSPRPRKVRSLSSRRSLTLSIRSSSAPPFLLQIYSVWPFSSWSVADWWGSHEIHLFHFSIYLDLWVFSLVLVIFQDMKNDPLKKVIPAMTIGMNVSYLYIDVMNCMRLGIWSLRKGNIVAFFEPIKAVTRLFSSEDQWIQDEDKWHNKSVSREPSTMLWKETLDAEAFAKEKSMANTRNMPFLFFSQGGIIKSLY